MSIIQPRDVLQPLIDSIFQVKYQSMPFYTDLNAMVRYGAISLPTIIPHTKTDPPAELAMSIRYYKELAKANRDLMRIPDYIQYAELWVADGVVYSTNRGPSPKPAGDPTSTYTSIPDAAIINALNAIFINFYKARWDYDPDNYYAVITYWNDAVQDSLVDPPTITYPAYLQAMAIAFYKQRSVAENELFNISPGERLAQFWMNGRKIESNR